MNFKICIGILLVLFYLSGCCQDPELTACVKEWQDKGLEPGVDYVPKEVLVGFGIESAITELEATALIASAGYGLQEFNDSTKVATVRVQSGKEFEAICKIERIDSVSYAEPNYLAHNF